MRFYADLHVHSKHSRTASRDSDLENLAWWAGRKGISVLATGDFTHPAWRQQIREKLVSDGSRGLLRLRDDLERKRQQNLPASCRHPLRFMLSAEVCTAYAKEERTRKIHHLIYVPDLETAERLASRLAGASNLLSEGRPTVRLTARELLEATLESDPESFLVPAHVWRPGSAVLDATSGFEQMQDCYEDLAAHVFAVETGLSSDPPMNWRVSALDRYRLVSNSDAHSPHDIAREASWFTGEPDYFAMREALETGAGYGGTVNSFPETEKHYLDGHRRCGIDPDTAGRSTPSSKCAHCGEPLSHGVRHRVAQLADRDEGVHPTTAHPFKRLIPLAEILGELNRVGPGSKTVFAEASRLCARLGTELEILLHVPSEDLQRHGSTLLDEAITRLRRGKVRYRPGYGGEQGEVRLFDPGEVERRVVGAPLFAPPPAARERAASDEPLTPRIETSPVGPSEGGIRDQARDPSTTQAGRSRRRSRNDPLADLSESQRTMAEHEQGPLLVLGDPGSGKTHAMIRRLASVLGSGQAHSRECLTLTTNAHAACGLARQVSEFLPARQNSGTITTPRRFGLRILRKHYASAGLRRSFRVADDDERIALVQEWFGLTAVRSRQLLSQISVLKRHTLPRQNPSPDAVTEASALIDHYREQMAVRGLLDRDDVLELPVRLLERNPRLRKSYTDLYRWISVDEFQAMDALEYRLVRVLAPANANLCALGVSGQAPQPPGPGRPILDRFRADYPTATILRLTGNHRSTPALITAAQNFVERGTEQRAPTNRGVQTHETGAGAAPPIQIFQARTERSEGEFLAREIETLLANPPTEANPGGALRFADCAILVRTAGDAKPIAAALQRAGIPFQAHDHEPLLADPGVRNIARRLRRRNGPRNEAGAPALPFEGSVRERIELAAREAAVAQELRLAPTTETATGGTTTAAEVREAANLLQPLAEQFDHDVAAFLRELALARGIDARDANANRVSLLTLEAARGLEFEAVFLAGADQRAVPRTTNGACEDETWINHLFLVGLTRARSRLTISWPRRRRCRGQILAITPPPFLDEIGPELLAKHRGRPRKRRVGQSARQLALL